jgi:Mu transposase, C-terminal domain
VPVPKVASLAELNARLAEADAAEDARHIAGRPVSIGEDFAAGRGRLLPLPPEPFATATVLWPRVDRYARISVGKCRYSVPARLIGSRVRVMLSASELRVFDGPALAAVHPRLIAAGDEHLELDHYLEIVIRKPGALPGAAALAQAAGRGHAGPAACADPPATAPSTAGAAPPGGPAEPGTGWLAPARPSRWWPVRPWHPAPPGAAPRR